ncbi:MAG: hypothetical protein WCB11_00850 [Terriglobales bacterium]
MSHELRPVCLLLFQGHAVESELLFRSTKSADFRTRIDILFKGVSEFHLRTSSHGLSITQASDSDVQSVFSLLKHLSPEHGRKLFMVKGEDFVGHVAALVVAAHEDEGEYSDPSFFARQISHESEGH